MSGNNARGTHGSRDFGGGWEPFPNMEKVLKGVLENI